MDTLSSQAAAACSPGLPAWPQAQCEASVIASSRNSCPTRLHKTWRTSTPEGCRSDGMYKFFDGSPDGYRFFGPWNRSSAFGVDAARCSTFEWTHAKGPRPLHSGPAIVGADRDIKHVLQHGDAKTGVRLPTVNLLHLGMRPDERRAGLWSPCTNLAFVMCGMHGWLPGQAGHARFYLATSISRIGLRCRPCGPCNVSMHTFNECSIVKAELCMLAAGCRNGNSVWNTTGEWMCELDDTQIPALDE